MSTRCTINFCWGKEIAAKVYRHSDGYPDGVLPDLERFFQDVEEQTTDHRYSDPSYLAAKFVVWQAHETAVKFVLNEETRKYCHIPANMLDFLGVGIVQEDPGDIEYTYFLDCDNAQSPVITWREA